MTPSGDSSVGADDRQTTVLQTIDLHMVYQSGAVDVHALRGVDLKVRDGEFLSLWGPSGCGKSTFLHIIAGMLTPTSGRAIVKGDDLGRMSDAERTDLRRREIGFVFQRPNLFPTLTVEGNLRLAQRIYFGKRAKTNGRVDGYEEILAMLGLEDKLLRKPAELSGGEQQRVAIARALIHRPSILLADEPTGNLDSVNSALVLRMLRRLNERRGETIVMITHDPEVADYSTRSVRFKDGRIDG
jgi:putative ABC transport system ATP-binding protein